MQTSNFDPKLWLASLTELGGGYALMAGRKLFLAVDKCESEALSSIMSQIIGQPDRQEELKRSIEQRQQPEVKS